MLAEASASRSAGWPRRWAPRRRRCSFAGREVHRVAGADGPTDNAKVVVLPADLWEAVRGLVGGARWRR